MKREGKGGGKNLRSNLQSRGDMEIVLKTVPSLGTNSLLSIFSEERFVINYLATGF